MIDSDEAFTNEYLKMQHYQRLLLVFFDKKCNLLYVHLLFILRQDMKYVSKYTKDTASIVFII